MCTSASPLSKDTTVCLSHVEDGRGIAPQRTFVGHHGGVVKCVRWRRGGRGLITHKSYAFVFFVGLTRLGIDLPSFGDVKGLGFWVLGFGPRAGPRGVLSDCTGPDGEERVLRVSADFLCTIVGPRGTHDASFRVTINRFSCPQTTASFQNTVRRNLSKHKSRTCALS